VKLSDIINLTPAQRRRLRNWGAPVKKPHRKRPSFSRQELVEYLRKNEIRSWRTLERKRADGDPIPFDYRREFGSWQAAVEEVFGKPVVPVKVDSKYVLRAVPFFNAWTYRGYLAARRLSPHVLPSMNFVIKEFGSFELFIVCARGMSLKMVLDDYLALGRKLGRRPKLDECEAAGLKMEFALKFCRGKARLDDLADGVGGQKLPRREQKTQ
jgi:hypothetical protein